MITFLTALAALISSYFIYGKFVEKVFKPDDNRPTPAIALADGVDYVAMPTWKAFLIQILNIAGTGPIFGALMGAVFGPIVYLWIVFGCILGGAVHDFYIGMISCRMGGATIADIVGKYLGRPMKIFIRVFSVILLIMLCAVFAMSPAALLAMLTVEALDMKFWLFVILIYYILATILPIDKIIGKAYPIFGALMLAMVCCTIIAIFAKGYTMPELTLANLHPDGMNPWPYMFVTVACGAVSGFHATQSPIIARCIKKETDGRRVFYMAMLAEGMIALMWAAAGMSFYGSTGSLENALMTMGQSGVVYDICTGLMGKAGGVLAIIAVVLCPITSGDTSLRSARLMLAEWLHMDQKKIGKRLLLTLPLIAVSIILIRLDFDVIWRYTACANQAMAAVALWAAAAYIAIEISRKACVIAAAPAFFMTAVSCTYILVADEGLKLPAVIGYPLGAGIAVFCVILFIVKIIFGKKLKKILG